MNRRLELQIQKELLKILKKSKVLILNEQKLKAWVNSTQFQEYTTSLASRIVNKLLGGYRRQYPQLYRLISKERRATMIQTQVLETASLIRSMPLNMAQEVSTQIANQHLKGVRATTLAAEILEKYPQLSKAKANLVARTEVARTNTMLLENDCHEVGIGWYIWRSTHDVRTRSSHNHMDGVVCSWSDPPNPEKLAKTSKDYGSYHPGCIFNCRCFPSPLVTADQIPSNLKVHLHGTIVRMSKKEFIQKYWKGVL